MAQLPDKQTCIVTSSNKGILSIQVVCKVADKHFQSASRRGQLFLADLEKA